MKLHKNCTTDYLFICLLQDTFAGKEQNNSYNTKS